MKQNETKKVQKSSEKYQCEKCDFSTCRKSHYVRHILTPKHNNETNETILKQKGSEKYYTYKCECGIIFNSRTTLWRHKKTCSYETSINNPSDKDLIMLLIKENSELKNMVLDMCQKIQPSNNTVNSHNKTFNLNLFLNETCKDAMNIMDFVDSVKVQLSDLETIGNTGFVNGISKIIIKNLKDLDVTKRPLHCTDSKREILYVKDENKWGKENEDKDKLKKVINKISNKNIQQISTWSEQNPKYKDSETNQNTEYLKIVNESMGCSDSNNYTKIIHNITKEVAIDK